jgi:hypothetical protein
MDRQDIVLLNARRQPPDAWDIPRVAIMPRDFNDPLRLMSVAMADQVPISPLPAKDPPASP